MTDIRKLNFFSEFDDEQIEKLKSISTQKSYQKNEMLFFEGDEPKFLHLLIDGVLKMYKTDFKSNEIFLHQLVATTFVAELANFESIPYPASAQFLTSGEVLKIEYEKFLEEFVSNPSINLKIIKSLTGKLKIMSEVIHKELILTSEAKLARFIMDNGELFGMIKNVKIASLLNITPETLSRALAKMKKDGLVKFDAKNKLIHANKEMLTSLYA